MADQELKGGNLALSKSQQDGQPVRVLRAIKAGPMGARLVYLGLYTVKETRLERGRDEFKVRLALPACRTTSRRGLAREHPQ